MILKKAIDKFYGRNVKIGATAGSGYVYCGPMNETIIDILDDTSARYLNYVEKELKTLKNRRKRTSVNSKVAKFIQGDIDKFQTILNTWVPLSERPIMQTFTDYEGNKVLLYNGTENGKYWTIQECQEDLLKRANGQNVADENEFNPDKEDDAAI